MEHTPVTIAVVIPAYRTAEQIGAVCLAVAETGVADHIFVVDDGCPDGSGKLAERLAIDGLAVLYHGENRGVGAAVATGYARAAALGCDIIVKIDGDGQMDPRHIRRLVDPLIGDEADYVKGNRFGDWTALKNMPAVRLFGNSILSFLVKAASGYWNIMDPTNGFTAIHRRALERIDIEKLDRRYFFETDMLIRLNIANAVVRDMDIPARYGAEKSSLRIAAALWKFPPLLLAGLARRVFLKYFINDFNMASVYLLVGLPTFLASIILGIAEWVDSVVTGAPKTAGTIMLVALPIIVSFQMLMQAIQIDIGSVPRKR